MWLLSWLDVYPTKGNEKYKTKGEAQISLMSKRAFHERKSRAKKEVLVNQFCSSTQMNILGVHHARFCIAVCVANPNTRGA